MNFIDKYGNVELRALSWKQPYCSLMMHDKDETRVWPTDYRGWVLMCASKAAYPKETVYNICGNYDRYMTIVKTLQHDNTARLSGMAICIGKLIDCRPMTPADEDKAFVQYHEPWVEERKDKKTGKIKLVNCQLWLHIYQSVQPIMPIFWTGSQGWRQVSTEFKQQIQLL